MKLDPAEHYMYWIITFAGMLFACVLLLILGSNFNLISMALFPYIVAGIFSFIILFMSVVLYLSLIWPNIYKKEQLKYKD